MRNELRERRERAELKAVPLINKYRKMSLQQKLQYIRNNKIEWKTDRNFINRYYNLIARENGFAKGMKQAAQEGFIQ